MITGNREPTCFGGVKPNPLLLGSEHCYEQRQLFVMGVPQVTTKGSAYILCSVVVLLLVRRRSLSAPFLPVRALMLLLFGLSNLWGRLTGCAQNGMQHGDCQRCRCSCWRRV